MNVYNFDTMEHSNRLDGAISGNSQRHRQFNFSSLVELEPLLEEGYSGGGQLVAWHDNTSIEGRKDFDEYTAIE